MESFAFLAVIRGNNERAARLLGAAEALRDVLDGGMQPQEKMEYDYHVAQLRETMDNDALEAAWRAGRLLDIDAAVAYARYDQT